MKTLLPLVLLLASAITGCGKDEGLKIDPVLRPYLEKYLSVAPSEGRLSLLASVEFGEPPEGDDLGICLMPYRGTREHQIIREDRRIIVRYPEVFNAAFTRTMMHEFGHCLHDMIHNEDPDTIMSLYNDNFPEYWEANLDEKLVEMFSRP